MTSKPLLATLALFAVIIGLGVSGAVLADRLLPDYKNVTEHHRFSESAALFDASDIKPSVYPWNLLEEQNSVPFADSGNDTADFDAAVLLLDTVVDSPVTGTYHFADNARFDANRSIGYLKDYPVRVGDTDALLSLAITGDEINFFHLGAAKPASYTDETLKKAQKQTALLAAVLTAQDVATVEEFVFSSQTLPSEMRSAQAFPTTPHEIVPAYIAAMTELSRFFTRLEEMFASTRFTCCGAQSIFPGALTANNSSFIVGSEIWMVFECGESNNLYETILMYDINTSRITGFSTHHLG